MRRTVGVVILCGLAAPLAAARPGDVADPSRATIAISASVAGQARASGAGDRVCLWSNTATRLLTVRAIDADGTMRPLTRDGGMVAAATPGCDADGSTAAAGPTARAILISPE